MNFHTSINTGNEGLYWTGKLKKMVPQVEVVLFTAYADIALAVEGMKSTVNLCHPLQSDCLAFLDENNLPGIGEWITKNRLGAFIGVKAYSGFCVYPLYLLFKERV